MLYLSERNILEYFSLNYPLPLLVVIRLERVTKYAAVLPAFEVLTEFSRTLKQINYCNNHH